MVTMPQQYTRSNQLQIQRPRDRRDQLCTHTIQWYGLLSLSRLNTPGLEWRPRLPVLLVSFEEVAQVDSGAFLDCTYISPPDQITKLSLLSDCLHFLLIPGYAFSFSEAHSLLQQAFHSFR